MKSDDLLLYAVTDRAWLNGKTLAHDAELALKGGATMLQLREKHIARELFLSEARELKALCDRYGVTFIINDDVDLALQCGAHGVHVGQSDEDAVSARRKLGDYKIIGVSASTVEQAVAAQAAGADYIGVGAVFPTGTKSDADAVSLDTLRAICSCVSIPVVAIGGITCDNILQLAGSGISGVAVVSAIFAADDIESAARELTKLAKQL